MKDALLAPLPDWDIAELQLGNGLRVVAIETPSPLLAMQLRFPGGPLFEEIGQEGITHFLEHVMLAGGTKTNPTRQARDNEAYRMIARYNYWTNTDQLCEWMLGAASRSLEMLAFMRDGVFSPAFPAHEVEAEKKVVIQEMREHVSDPKRFSQDSLINHAWSGHPISRPILGTKESLIPLRMGDIVPHHSQFISPNRGRLFIAGGVNVHDLLRQADDVFSGVAITIDSDLITPPSPRGIRSGIQVIANAGLPNTHIRIGIDTHGLTGDSLALDLFTNVLRNRNFYSFAGGDRNKIAYTAHTETWFEKDFGLLIPYVITDPENVPRVLEQILENMAKPISADELRVVREGWALNYLESQEGVWPILEGIINDYYYHGKSKSNYGIVEEFNEISLEEVEAVRRKLNEPKSFAVLTYGQDPGEASLAAWN